MSKDQASDIAAIVAADHHDPFSVLGAHATADGRCVLRTFLPGVDGVDVIDRAGDRLGAMRRIHDAGVYACTLDGPAPAFYRLRISRGGAVNIIDDPYRFPSTLTADDARLLAAGAHLESYRILGAHPATIDDVYGVRFAVWAPAARRVSVVGPFNDWDGRRHPMRNHPGCGVWEMFLPGLGEGALYKYEIRAADGRVLPLKSDPHALRAERPPRTASIVHRLDGFDWTDDHWMAERGAVPHHRAPISIYEVHPGSWRRAENGARAQL